jgi:hypothetical protein
MRLLVNEIKRNTEDKTLILVVVLVESKLTAMVISNIVKTKKKLDNPISALFSPECKL